MPLWRSRRDLNVVEKQFVGDWGTIGGNKLCYTFNADGIFINQQSEKRIRGTFKAASSDSICLVELKKEDSEHYVNLYYNIEEPDKLLYDDRPDMYNKRY